MTLLQSATKYRYEESSMAALNIPLASAKWNALSKANISALDDWGSDLVEKQLLSYMFRLNYDYNSRYLLTLSGRWDGASQLAKGNKWAFFPSAALGWRLDQEGFLQDVSWLNQLKLRVGVGVTGNSAIDPYQTKGAVVPIYYPYGDSSTSGFVASDPVATGGTVAMANKDLTWEKTTQYNICTERKNFGSFGFLYFAHNRLIDADGNSFIKWLYPNLCQCGGNFQYRCGYHIEYCEYPDPGL